MMNIEPCPFCGGVAETFTLCSKKQIEAYVQCSHCFARGPNYACVAYLNGEFEDSIEVLTEYAVKEWSNGRN